MVRVQKLTLFLPRDAIRYSAVFAVVRCPSIRLTITFVHCIQTAEDIVKHLCRPGSLTILVFCPQSPILNFKENPFGWGAKYTGWEKFAIFDWNRRLSRKRYKIGPYCHGTFIGSHRWRINTWRFRWPWVTTNPGRSLYTYKSNISKTSYRDKATIEH